MLGLSFSQFKSSQCFKILAKILFKLTYLIKWGNIPIEIVKCFFLFISSDEDIGLEDLLNNNVFPHNFSHCHLMWQQNLSENQWIHILLYLLLEDIVVYRTDTFISTEVIQFVPMTKDGQGLYIDNTSTVIKSSMSKWCRSFILGLTKQLV